MLRYWPNAPTQSPYYERPLPGKLLSKVHPAIDANPIRISQATMRANSPLSVW